MSATTSYKWAVVNENWAPLSGVQVEALNLTTLQPDDVQRTGLDGVVTFTGLPAGPHIPRVRARRVSTKVGGRTYTGQVRLIPIAMGNQGITKHYVVDANGMGTHTTIQAAVTAAIALGSGFEVVIYCNPGTYTEDVTVPFAATAGAIYLVGEGSVKNLDSGTYNSIVTLQGTTTTDPVMELSGTGSLSAVGIDFKPKLGSSGETIKMATGNDLELNDCKVTSWTVGFTAVIDLRCRNCIISTGGRIIDATNQMYFEHCYLSGAGLIKGNWGTLVVNDCILLGTAPAGEYWIEEDILVISTGLYVTKCISSAGGGGGFIRCGDQSAGSDDCIIAHNKITLGSGEKGIYLVELTGAVVTDNVIEGANNADGSTAIEVAASAACRGCVIAHNSIRTIQNGVVIGANGTDGSCVIGPNAYYDVGTDTSGVPAAEDYQVSLATASAAGDAADLTYTPGVAADWDGDADPGDQDEANDQLAERVTDLEERGVYEYGSSATAVFGETAIWYASTPFIGSVSGATTSTSVTYNHTSGETSLMRGMVLHNTTKGEKVYIAAVNIATNTLTVEANSPDDASTWDNLDVLTTASQTNTGRTATFVDIDVTPHIISGSVPSGCILTGYGTRRNADNWWLITHPYEAYDVNKEHTAFKMIVDDTLLVQIIVPLTVDSGRYVFTLNLLGLSAANAATLFRWAGQFSKLVA